MSFPKLNLKRRWIKSRPGSVLILVIALLVLLALIGTAYLSTTQTERYSAQQNSANVEADLLIQGVIDAINSSVGGSLFASTGNGLQFRPPGQDMPTYPNGAFTKAPPASGYYNYDSLATDLFLAPRHPYNLGNSIPTWAGFSWPVFGDGNGGYSVDSPFDNSVALVVASNKNLIQAIPTYKIINGQTYPAFIYYVPPSTTSTANTITLLGGQTYTVTGVGAIIPPNGIPVEAGAAGLFAGNMQNMQSYAVVAASSAGDGIADSAMFKVPVGQINGITYYASYRCIDNNSAINASTAWTSAADPSTTAPQQANYGFFPSNIGLLEQLNSQPGQTITPAQEMYALNSYRFHTSNPNSAVGPTSSTPSTFTLTSGFPQPQTDPTVVSPPTNFDWYSYGDALYSQLSRRPGNPGALGPGGALGQWLGGSQSAALAYHFSLTNPNAAPSILEQLLPNELLNYSTVRSTPYSPDQAQRWYIDLFQSQSNTTNTIPMRTYLTTSNAVSLATPSRFGNASATTPVAWAAGVNYNFGDWVVDNQSATGNSPRSFVCIRAHASTASNKPQVTQNTGDATSGYNATATAYWAGASGAVASATSNPRPPGLPFLRQPVKTSVNTATFGELYLAFAQVMTDSIGADPNGTNTKAWQPPMQGITPPPPTGLNTAEYQLPMFRSVIRDSGVTPRRLTPSQMLQIRAAIAAVNTMDLRKGENNPGAPTRAVTSQHIQLMDPTTGAYAYDVEVFGTQKQPYLSELFIHIDSQTPSNNFIALKLVNPYTQAIPLTNWAFGSLNRSAQRTSANSYNYQMTPANTNSLLPIGTTIPAATNIGTAAPGLLVLYEGSNVPSDVATEMALGTAVTKVAVTGLLDAAGITSGQLNELFIMRPRRNDGTFTKADTDTTNGDDLFVEQSASGSAIPNISEMVPVDQVDLTGLQLPNTSNPVERIVYRRGSDAQNGRAWNNIFPGYYNGTSTAGPLGRYFSNYDGTNYTGAAIITSTGNPLSYPCNLSYPDGSAAAYDPSGTNASASTYKTCPIQLNNTAMAGPNTVGLATMGAYQMYPFGGFARNLDMLQIPFIGAYRITNLSGGHQTVQVPMPLTLVEMNSVTMDSALATDLTINSTTNPGLMANANFGKTSWAATDATTNPFIEQIGRFCPIGNPAALDDPSKMDFSSKNLYYHYHWARRLFSYLTVQAPHDDYYPNVDPTQADGSITSTRSPSTQFPQAYTGARPPAAVSNNTTNTSYANATTPPNQEDTVGVQGLVNINTAPYAVLAAVPWTNTTNGTIVGTALGVSQVNVNATLAGYIVAYRDQNGPFKSIYDLYQVPKFKQANDALLVNATGMGPANGVFSPGAPTLGVTGQNTQTPAGIVRYDFLERFLLLNNVSNLITTRSDTFTCYVLLQGYRNAGTGNAALAVQRRAAFTIDRGSVTPSNTKATYTLFPNQ